MSLKFLLQRLRLLNCNLLLKYKIKMLAWLDFLNLFFFFLLISFIVISTNFLVLLLFSELFWIFLYCFVVILGSINDDLNLISLSFYFLGLAGVEFSFGFLLVVLFKQLNEPLIFKTYAESTFSFKFNKLNSFNFL